MKEKILLVIVLFSLLSIIIYKRFAIPKLEIQLGDKALIGDVDGNGKVNTTDYILIKKYILGISQLDSSKQKRADINGDNKINSTDYIMVKKIILNKDAVPREVTDNVQVLKVTKIHFIKTATSGHDASDSILIESNGEYGLIDASNPSKGDWSSSTTNGLTVLKYLEDIGVKHLKFVIASHAHSDHIGGIPDVVNGSTLIDSSTTFIYKQTRKDSNSYGETLLYDGNKFGPPGEDWLSYEFLETAKSVMRAKGAVLLDTTNPKKNLSSLGASYVSDGNEWTSYITFNMGDLTFKIYNLPLYTEKVNNKEYMDHNSNSLVTLITSSSGKKILLSGDLNTRSSYEEYYASKIGKVDILKANHHGYLFSNSRSFLQNTKPNYMVVMGDASNQEFVAPYLYLKSINTNVYSIDKGAVVFTIDSSISVSRKDDTVSYSGNKWYKWTIKDENVVWIYLEKGVMQKNKWVQDKGSWYYLGSDGIMSTNKWIQYESKWCYVGSDGKAYINGWYTIDGKKYHFDQSGYCDNGNGC